LREALPRPQLAEWAPLVRSLPQAAVPADAPQLPAARTQAARRESEALPASRLPAPQPSVSAGLRPEPDVQLELALSPERLPA